MIKYLKWGFLFLAFAPLLLCIYEFELTLTQGQPDWAAQTNRLYSMGILGFVLLLTTSAALYLFEQRGRVKAYLATRGGRTHAACALAFAATLLALHSGYVFFGDDTNFLKVFQQWPTGNYIATFCYHTSPTVLIHGLLFGLLQHNVWWWRVYDVLMIMLGAECAIRIAIPEGKRQYAATVYLLLLFFMPGLMLCDAGYGATTLNYVWPIGSAFFVMLLMKQTAEGTATGRYPKALGLLFLLLACNMIQCGTCMFPLACAALLYAGAQQGRTLRELPATLKANRYLCVVAAVALCSLAWDAFCPGNSARFAYSIDQCYPTYLQFSLAERLELGFINAMANIYGGLMGRTVAIPLLAVLLMAAWAKRKQTGLAPICALAAPATALLLAWLGRPHLQVNTALAGLLTNREVHSATWPDWLIHAEAAFYLALLCAAGYAILKCVESRKHSIFAILLLAASTESGTLMGFSPTVYASGVRCMMLSAVCILFAAVILLFAAGKELGWGRKHYMGYMAATVLLGIAFAWDGLLANPASPWIG